MKKQQDPNFLPQNEQQKANEVLQKQSQQGSAEMKLVVPKMEEGKKKEKKKESFWQRRKRKKEEKRLAKLRRKGETGAVKEALKKDNQPNISQKDSKPELFSDVIASRPQKETQPVAPSSKIKEEPKSDAKQMKTEKPATPKPVTKKESTPSKSEKESDKKITKQKMPAKVDTPPKKDEQVQKSKKMHQPEQKGDDFDGPSVNLVPDTMMQQKSGPKWVLGLVILLVTVAIWVIIGGIGISRAKKAEAQVQERTNRLNQLNKIIAEFDSGKIAAQSLQEQFDAVEGLIDNHLYWTPLLEKLEENTLSDVYYLAINADETTRVVSLRAIAKNYAAAARQIRSFQLVPNFISDVTVGEVRVENQPEAELPVPIVTFDLQLTLTEGVLTFSDPETVN